MDLAGAFGSNTPPADGTPPAGNPPVTPPAGNPPAGNPPPENTPPAGTPPAPWYANLADPAARQLMEAKAFTPDTLAKSYMEAQRVLSGATDVVALPPANAAPEVWDAYAAAVTKNLGVKDASSYQFTFADGLQIDEGFKGFAADMFLKAGVPPALAQRAVGQWQDFVMARVVEENKLVQDNNKKALETMAAAAGAEWPSLQAKGASIAKSLGLSPEATEYFDRNKGFAPVAELYLALAQKLGKEAGFPGEGAAAATPANMSAEQVQAEINRLGTDPEFSKALYGKSEPGHKEAVERMKGLYELKAAKTPKA